MSNILDLSTTSSSTLEDANGKALASATAAPGASDRGLVVRNIPSGTQPVSISATISTNSVAAATGGYTPIRIKSAATTNLTSVKTTAGVVGGIDVYNSGAGLAYLKLYRKASAPVLATDVPIAVFPIPANAGRSVKFGLPGIQMTTGIAYAITGGAADTDATAVAADQVQGVLLYV